MAHPRPAHEERTALSPLQRRAARRPRDRSGVRRRKRSRPAALVAGVIIAFALFEGGAQAAPGDLGPSQALGGTSVSDPAIAYNPTDNQYLAVWEAGAGDSDEIFARLLGPGGIPAGAGTAVSSAGPDGDAQRADVAYNSKRNEFMVVWEDDRLGTLESEIYAQRLSANGAEIEGDKRISQTGSDSDDNRSNFAAIAYNPVSDQYLTVFSRAVTDPGTFNQEIYGQRLSSTGAELGGDTQFTDLRARTDGESPPGTPQIDRGLTPDVASLPTGGGFLVAFSARDAMGFTAEVDPVFGCCVYHIHSKDEVNTLFVSSGGVAGAPNEISQMGGQDDHTTQASAPSITANTSAGQYLVLWTGDDTDGVFETFAQTVSAAGVELGPNDKPISGPDSPANPDAAHSSVANEYLTVWGKSGGTAIAQRLSAGLGEVGTDDASIGSGADPAAAFGSGPNEYLIAFRDSGSLFARSMEAPAPGPGPTPNPTPSPGAGAAPSNAYSVKGTKASSKRGIVTLSVEVPGPGTLTGKATAKVPTALLAAKKRGRRKRPRRILVARKTVRPKAAGRVTLRLKARRKARRVLKRKRKLKASVRLTYTPTGGTARTQKRKVTFKLGKRKRRKRQ